MLQVVELNEQDMANAADCARRRQAGSFDLAPGGDDDHAGRSEALRDWERALHYAEIGAQGEVASGRLVGQKAPLDVGTFHLRPDIPPNWNVKTQSQTSKPMLRGYMSLRPKDFHHGHRHVLVEKSLALHGRHLFAVHGWIADEDAREMTVQLYAWTRNRFVHIRHLQPVDLLCDLDESYWMEVADRWRFDDAGQLRKATDRDRFNDAIELCRPVAA